MKSIAPYSKAIVSILGALVVAVMQAFPDNDGVQQWGSIVAALVTALAVYAVPNKDPQGTHQDESTQPPTELPAGDYIPAKYSSDSKTAATYHDGTL